MTLKNLFTSKTKTAAVIFLILIAVGFVGSFVVGIIWWIRIDPWMRSGFSINVSVYRAVLSAWILSLIGFLTTALFLISFFFIKSLFKKISSSTAISIIYTLLIFCPAVASFIAGLLASIDGFKIISDDEKSFFFRFEFDIQDKQCSRYIIHGYMSALENTVTENSNTISNYGVIIKIINEKMVLQYHNSGFICDNVLYPMLIFEIILAICSIIYFILALTRICKSSEDNSSNEG